MTVWLYVGFITIILSLLILDLGVLNRKAHVIKTREALMWTGFYITLALMFNVLVYFIFENHWFGMGTGDTPKSGKTAAMEFFLGYVIEESLSMDNLFVIAMIFNYFRVPLIHQHRVLFWGIVGALVMRGLMIGAGAALIHKFSWMNYVFGGFLILTAAKMLVVNSEEVDPERNWLVRLARRVYPVTTEFDGQRFFTMSNGRRMMTPLFLVLLMVESTDVMFAIDSVPAIFAVTEEPFIVFTSNVFAILGLRSLYFALANLMEKFRYLKPSLVFLLAYIGAKMIISYHYGLHIDPIVSLGIIVSILSVGILASIIADRGQSGKRPPEAPSGDAL